MMNLKSHSQPSQPFSRLRQKLWRCLWIGLLSFYLAAPASLKAQALTIKLEIRYRMPDAGRVNLIWGIDDWQPVPEEMQPAGTTLNNTKMITPMNREGEVFVVKLQVPVRSRVDYGFWIHQNRAGEPVEVWEPAESSFRATDDAVVEVQTRFGLSGNSIVLRVEPETLTTQELRYYSSGDITEVTLVWDVDGQLLPETVWPPHTQIQEGQMYTSMQPQEDYFTVALHFPVNKRINYRFWVSEKGESGPNQSWDDNGGNGYQTSVESGEVVEIRTNEASAKLVDGLLEVGWYLGLGLAGIGLLSLGLYLLPLRHPLEVGLVLMGVVVMGLMIRLGLIWQMEPAPISASETLYLTWAEAIRQGNWPEVRILYPFFLTICYRLLGNSQTSIFYVQAALGTSLILLTFWLASLFTGTRLALWAATLTALQPGLVFQVNRLSDETLYTVLLALAALSLLWALKAPELWRFALAGSLLGITLLARPTLVFFPLLLLLLLPNFWGRARRWGLSLVYAGIVGAVIFLTGLYRLPAGLDGVALWEGSPEFYHLIEEQQSPQEIKQAYLEPGRNALTLAGNYYWGSRALSSIEAETTTYGSYFLLKPLFFWIGHPTLDSSQSIINLQTLLERFPAPYVAMLVASQLLPLLALLALIILHMVHQQSELLSPLLVICGYFMIIHSLTNAGLFASEPLYPFLIVMIATAIKPAHVYPSPYWLPSRRWSYT